jgi:hypothetical protein
LRERIRSRRGRGRIKAGFHVSAVRVRKRARCWLIVVMRCEVGGDGSVELVEKRWFRRGLDRSVGRAGRELGTPTARLEVGGAVVAHPLFCYGPPCRITSAERPHCERRALVRRSLSFLPNSCRSLLCELVRRCNRESSFLPSWRSLLPRCRIACEPVLVLLVVGGLVEVEVRRGERVDGKGGREGVFLAPQCTAKLRRRRRQRVGAHAALCSPQAGRVPHEGGPRRVAG